jgi:hypothetical protein
MRRQIDLNASNEFQQDNGNTILAACLRPSRCVRRVLTALIGADTVKTT